MSLAYSTLQSHAEAAATQAMLVADLRAEVAMLRKQLQLYRMEGAPRDYKDSTLMIGNGVAASVAAGANGAGTYPGSPSASRQSSTMQLHRNGSSSGFDRDRDDAKQGGGYGNSDREIFTRQPSSSSAAAADRELFTRQASSSSSSGGPAAFTRPASLFTKGGGAEDNEPRFQAPPSRDSPSSRLASGRAFGGAGSERLELSLSGGGTASILAMQRSPSGNLGRGEFGTGSLNGGAGERDDLVSDLNPQAYGGGGLHRAGSSSSFDRRPSMERDREGGASAIHLGATQEFSVNYGEP